MINQLAAYLDSAAVGILQPGDRPQQRALAATGLAHQDGEFPRGNFQIHAANGVHLSVVFV